MANSISRVASILLALTGLLLAIACSSRSGGERPLTADAKAYVRNLKLSDVSMKATESYAKQTLIEIEGKMENAGDRSVSSAAVYCVFYDSYGQGVLRERAPIVKTPLKPGESRSFRLPFDDIPPSWNNQMPQLVIAAIDFS